LGLWEKLAVRGDLRGRKLGFVTDERAFL